MVLGESGSRGSSWVELLGVSRKVIMGVSGDISRVRYGDGPLLPGSWGFSSAPMIPHGGGPSPYRLPEMTQDTPRTTSSKPPSE